MDVTDLKFEDHIHLSDISKDENIKRNKNCFAGNHSRFCLLATFSLVEKFAFLQERICLKS